LSTKAAPAELTLPLPHAGWCLQNLRVKNSSSTPMSMQADSTSERFARQLPIWGDYAQRLLQRARVVVIGGTSSAAEAIKCLVLGGVGSILLVDSARITPADTEGNFFLPPWTVGEWRATALLRSLVKLSPTTRFTARLGTAQTLVNEWTTLQPLSMVILTEGTSAEKQQLAKFCWYSAIPLFIVSVHGFGGSLIPQFPERVFFRSTGLRPAVHTIEYLQAIRVMNPFNALAEWCTKRFWPLQQWSPSQLAAIPWPVLVVLALQQANRSMRPENRDPRQSTNTDRATTSDGCRCTEAEEREHRHEPTEAGGALTQAALPRERQSRGAGALLVPGCFSAVSGGSASEAVSSRIERALILLRKWEPSELTSANWNMAVAALQKLRTASADPDPRIIRESCSLRNRQLVRILEATRAFATQHGWPVFSDLGELHGDPESVHELRRLYWEQAEHDIETIWRLVRADPMEAEAPDSISKELVREVCSNLFFMKTWRTQPFYCLFEDAAVEKPQLAPPTTAAQRRAASLFLALIAHECCQELDRTQQLVRRHGADAVLLEEAQRIARLWSWPPDLIDSVRLRHLAELFAEEEHPSMPIMLGSLAAQEAMKLVIQLFEPLTTILVYDGLADKADLLHPAVAS